ncbi:FG-GAP-like repeat-containing protein [Hymenobacter nivis]|uniref:T9SS C-terminal target domain-containing protein n=1 Tax=Hymenobacter nivis TaxID=1850093 RepID=A0A502GVF4_9BACT|nr:FG-GAP-like repeat-containing protein [Hymenobacter nivis]TPG65615.1 T9SS C-terminal target domain-containing protein [Hymenobacter nivis]
MKLPSTVFGRRLAAGAGYAAALGALLAGPAQAQGPIATSVSPSRNTANAPRNTTVAVTFNQALANNATTLGALKVFSAQAGGKKAGTATVNGSTLRFQPTTAFKAGETVLATATAGAQSSSGAPAKPQVFQFTTATTPTNGLFGGGQDLQVGSSINGVATGDLNGDGTLDLVTTDERGGTANIRFNDGRGIFAGGQSLPLGDGPRDVVLADVNGDGALDIVAINGGFRSTTLSIRYNDGRGGFRGDNGQNLAVRRSPTGVALGDLDGDGDLDLVASSFDNGNGGIDVRFNNGAGTFSGGTSTALPVGMLSLALGDFDGDGDLDLVSANPAGLGVSLNDGAGAFGAAGQVPTAARPSKVMVGDVDGDGDLDLLAVEYPYAVGIRLNDGAGNFRTGQEIAVPVSYGDCLALGDVDGDGDLDLVTGNNNGSPKAAVLLNNGAGTFVPGPEVDTGNGNTSLVLGDVDNDGDLDVVAGGLSSQVSVRLNQPPAVVLNPPTLASASPATGVAGSDEVIVLTGTNFTPAAKVTFNGAAATGVVVASATELRVTVPAGATSGPVVVTTADGVSNGLAFTVRPAGFPLLSIASVAPTANANGAPTATAVAVTFAQAPASGSGIEQALQVFSQQAGGRKAGTSRLSGSTLTFQPAAAFKAGETVLATAVGSPSRVFQFTTATAPTSGIFGGGTQVPTGTTLTDLVTGDVNGDGNLDILTANGGNGDVSIRLNNGDGTYNDGFNSFFPSGNLARLALGDVDGDGDLDVLVTTYLRFSVSTSNILEYLNDGKGNFTAKDYIQLGASTSRLVLGDVDGDGDLDLLAPSIAVDGNFLRFEVNVRLNDGRGKFSGNQNLALGASELALGDADGDGDLDLFTSQSDGIGLSLNNGQGIFGVSRPLGLGAATGRLLLGDLNGDGRLDVAGGAASIGLNDGTGTFARAPAAGLAATALGDVDGDGDLDLVGPGGTGATVSVRLNNGQGGFGGSQEVAVAGAASAVVLGDVDSDGDLDILAGSAATPFNNSTVSVRLNQKQAPVLAAYRLNAGAGPLTTSRGTFATDQSFDAANSDQFTTQAPIAGTPDPALYQTERFSTHGVLSYALPVANGKYNVVLHFAELYWTKPGQRVFDINLEGKKVATNYDIVQKVGPLTATTETFAVTVTDGVLNLDLSVPYLSGGMDQAKLSALEVLPFSTDYRVNAGAGALATSRGAFAADQSFDAANSATATTAAAIAGTPDPALYQTERYSTHGTLSYALPVANGQYNVVLHFAEIYWTKPGQRVFDINLEGAKVKSLYDIVQKVGPLTATTETFAVTVTDGVLNLDLSVPYLSGGMDQAKLSALEVLSANGSAAVAQVAARPSAAKKTSLAGSLSAYPNPAPEGNFTLAYTAAQAQAATLVLTDALGRIVQQRVVTLAEGPNQVPVQAPGLPVGIYQLTLRLANGQHPSQRLAIIH